LGAYGAAISIQEKMHLENRTGTTFRGLDSAINDRMDFKEKYAVQTLTAITNVNSRSMTLMVVAAFGGGMRTL